MDWRFILKFNSRHFVPINQLKINPFIILHLNFSKGGTLTIKNEGNQALSLVSFRKNWLPIGWNVRISPKSKIIAKTSPKCLHWIYTYVILSHNRLRDPGDGLPVQLDGGLLHWVQRCPGYHRSKILWAKDHITDESWSWGRSKIARNVWSRRMGHVTQANYTGQAPGGDTG